MCSDIETLQRFFSLENERNWRDYESYLSEDVEWILNENEKQVIIRGKKDYLERIRQAYNETDVKFTIRAIARCERTNRIVSILESDDGDISIDVFELRNGKIAREWEYIL
jgi:hypothetical protein